MPNPTDYKAIALWGKQVGSYQYYIDRDQKKAAAADAPTDALYERDGTWRTVRDLAADHPFHHQYEEFIRS